MQKPCKNAGRHGACLDRWGARGRLATAYQSGWRNAWAAFWRFSGPCGAGAPRALVGVSGGGRLGVLAGGFQSVPRGAEAVGGGRDGAVLAAVQDGQFGLCDFQKVMRTKGANSSVFTEGDANGDRS